MIGEKTFGVVVRGVYPSRMRKYGTLIMVDYTPKRKVSGMRVYYKRKVVEEEYPGKRLPSVVEDMINIALAVFSADKLVKRDIAVSTKRVESRYFTRKIKLVVPVSNKVLWENVQHKLEKMISFMTYDLFKFKFIKRSTKNIEVSSRKSEFDSISLFSGGLDSLGGSYFLLRNGYNPLFVSVNHSKIGKVLSKLYEVLPEGSSREITVKHAFKPAEYTQFSRSFLYLSFASAVAIAHEINKIFIPENGIIARQIGLKAGRYGTRTAHPMYLEYFNDLINSLFPEYKIKVENPFSYKTKAEIVKEIEDKERIKDTISCGHTLDLTFIGKTKIKHCGMCIPCLIRTIALVASDLPNVDEMLNVYFNPFLDIDFSNPRKVVAKNRIMKRRYRDALANVLDMLRLAYELKQMSYEDIVLLYPEFLDVNVYRLYKKFAQNLLRTVDYFSERNPTLKLVSERFTQ